MKNVGCLLALWLTSSLTQAQGLTGLASPESVVSANGRYFVSCIGPELNADKDGDGFISELSAKGEVINARFLPTGTHRLHAPKGMVIVQNTLYVTDIDRVVGFSLLSRQQIFEQTVLGTTTFLNDLCAVDEQTLLVSDSFGNRVLTLNVKTHRLTVLGAALTGANGLAYQAKTKMVYLATMGPNLDGSGKLFAKSLTNAAPFAPLPGSPVGVLDGLAITLDDHLLVSDWQSLTAATGRLYDYNPNRGQLDTLSYMGRSPADFWYDPTRRQLWVPQTLTNQVVRVALPNPLNGNHRRPVEPVYLFHTGLINGFLSGLYDGVTTYGTLKRRGGFGIGAPDRLDGEVTVLDGHVYQTQSSGHTFEPADTAQTPYAFVHPFRADTALTLSKVTNKHQFETLLDGLLTNANGLYAIRVGGQFRRVRTRAFPPVRQKPYPALTTMMDRQRFFAYETVTGDLVGYRLPTYLQGVNIPGYHFHFLSTDRTLGGHVLDFVAGSVTIQLQQLDGYTVDIPQTMGYRQIDLSRNRQADVKQVESGEKPNN